MKANEFKKILKPLIEQTVREVLLEQGVLSRVVSEVARGLNGVVLEESSKAAPSGKKQRYEADHDAQLKYEEQKQARIRRLNESSGLPKGIFDNVTEIGEPSPSSPLSGVSSGDPGVDISGIQKLANGKWKALAGRK